MVRAVHARGYAARQCQDAFDAATKGVQWPAVKAVLEKEDTEVLLSKWPRDFADYLARISRYRCSS